MLASVKILCFDGEERHCGANRRDSECKDIEQIIFSFEGRRVGLCIELYCVDETASAIKNLQRTRTAVAVPMFPV